MSSPLETDIYDDLYGDEGDTKTEEPTSQQTAEKPTNLPTPPIQAVKEEASEVKPLTGENSLPAKPTQSAELSYSAQIAQQFSAYKQTPAQERQQRTFPPAASKSSPGEPKSPEEAIEESSLRRQVRPSEMKDEGKLFIGGLSWDTTDEGLRNYFSEFGKVEDCTILRDPDGRSRGFAFLTFEDPNSVNAVMIRDHVLDGKSIDPKRAIPREEHLRNTRYFVGGLSHSTSSDSMRAFFSSYGKVVDCTVMVDRDTGRSKGFGFVTFEDASNTDQLVGNVGLILDDKPIEVKVAQPRSQREQARMKAAVGLPEGGAPVPTFAPTAQAAVGPQQMGMLYQRMMGQMPMMMGMNGMGVSMGMNGFGGGNMGGLPQGAGFGGMGGGMGGNMSGGMMGGMGSGMGGNMGGMGGNMGGGMRGGMAGMMGSGMRMGMGPMTMGMSGMGMTPFMNNPAAMRMGMMGAMNPMARGRGGSMVNAGVGPARNVTRGQHNFHPYSR